MISIDKCTGICNVLSLEIYVLKETKDINNKALNLIINKMEAKPMTKHISYNYKWKSSSTTCNWNQIWNNKKCKCGSKN